MKNAPVVLILATIGVAIAAAILLFPYEWSKFGKGPEFLVWTSFVAAQGGFSALVLFALFNAIRQLSKNLTRSDYLMIVMSLIAVVSLVALPGVIGRIYIPDMVSEPVPHLLGKVTAITVLAVLSSLLPVTVAMLVHIALGAAHRNGDPAQTNLELYIRLRTYLQRAVLISGVIFGIGVLSTGAYFDLRVVNDPQIDPQKFLVVAYAAYLSILIALFYAPIYLRLLAFGRDILDTLTPIPAVRSSDWVETYGKRKTLEEFLQLSISSGPMLKAGIPILVPLAGGIISLLSSPSS